MILNRNTSTLCKLIHNNNLSVLTKCLDRFVKKPINSKRLYMCAIFAWLCLILIVVIICFRVALILFDRSFLVHHQKHQLFSKHQNDLHREAFGADSYLLFRNSLPQPQSLPLSSSAEPYLTDFFGPTKSRTDSIKTLDELERFINSPLQVNPHQAKRAYSAFLSVSANDRKAYDYMIGILSLFQSIKLNSKDMNQNPFLLILVPPIIEELESVQKTLYFIEKIMNNLSEQDFGLFHFFIARYIDNPTNGKHSSSNSVERRYMDTFNKIHMWRLDEFGYEKVIYLDADVVIIRPEMDHLFECGHFCAVSDLCVPDYFNGGLMVLKPDTKVFLEMKDKMGVKEFQSYDGGEQGFINRYFNFDRNSVFWPLEKFSQMEHGIELQSSVKDDVYRLPFNYNGQVPLVFISKSGWNKFGDKIVAVHVTLPLKPWEFISFPIFDVSYYWYAIFRHTNVYRAFPWTLFSVNVILVLFGFVILDKVMNSKRKWTSILGLQWMVSAIENRINHLNGINDREFIFTTILLNGVPIFLIVPTTVLPIVLYMTELFIQHYDPHMIWLNLIMSIGAGAFIILGLFSLAISHCTPSNIPSVTFDNDTQVNPLEKLETAIVASNGNGWNYCIWVMTFVSYMFLGFFSLFLVPSFLFGYISINITLTVIYILVLLAVLIFRVLSPLADQVILHSLQNSFSKNCEKRIHLEVSNA